MKSTLACLFVLITASACAPSAWDGGAGDGGAEADSVLIQVLIGLHRADANAYASATQMLEAGEAVALSFSDISARDSVLALHGLDESAFNALIDEQLEYPARFLATYNRVLEGTAKN